MRERCERGAKGHRRTVWLSRVGRAPPAPQSWTNKAKETTISPQAGDELKQ
eukprot:CAMPEP_0204364228 /NCGR_PEP_ID=MMETSP0469-20131031/40978_1 /ASSEMBLY_ACC=CAM_ASM_000384 /TAXON_ID=2969 /ORGANISM="Oxyrrhis marina" /LENGTH=50 /DNA_ID=CAMNT_0051353095 /DNA_START=116 /DNA_END=265 /DNA_ORIENTATION=-